MSAYLDDVVAGYVECAIWAEADSHDSAPGGAETIADVAPESLAAAREEIAAFLEANDADLTGLEPGQIGHDFWLTRNGHGVGFWDRGLGDVGERLTGACRPYGGSSIYVGDDGRLYFD